MPVAATEGGDAATFPLHGFVQATPGQSSVTVTVGYEAPSGSSIRRLRIVLIGPGLSMQLFEAADAGQRVDWFGEASNLSSGTYTIRIEADVEQNGHLTSGVVERAVAVRPVSEPRISLARPERRPPEFPGVAGSSTRRLTSAESVTDGDIGTSVIEPVPRSAEVVVYGGSPSGVMAAVAAARTGASVILIESTGHVGGMMANGLTATDYGHPQTIGGITDEFFDRIEAFEGSAYGRWRFQPSSAEAILLTMLSQAGVALVVGEPLRETNGVEMDGTTIRRIHTTGRTIEGGIFIDASYEGDLMALAGVSHRTGRESSAEYGEMRAGVGVSASVFSVPVGLDAAVPLAAPTGSVGSGDNRIQYSNFRLCFSKDVANQVPFEAPANYDPSDYDLAAAYIASRVSRGHTPDITWFLWPVATTNGKFDVNNNGPVSIGIHGLNTEYPNGSYEKREEIAADLERYTRGFLHFLHSDSRVPSLIRSQMAAYGLCADEFVDNGNWPRLFYLREGRRMVGRHVVDERDVLVERVKPDTIAIASYAFDSHHISRWIDANRQLRLEGGFWSGRAAATRWSIPYRSLTPSADEATNLLVSVTASATHVADASLRMEPQYMLMGEAAGTAAAIASAGFGTQGQASMAVQEVPVESLRAALRSRGSIVDNYIFWDVVSTPFRGDIERTFLHGVTFGCSPLNFCPALATTREVMAAWLANALELPRATSDYFTDDETSPYEDAINRIAAAGITAGCSATTFCPTGSVTRGQMAAFLTRAFRLPWTARDYFTDDETSIFEGDINRLALSGITAGCGRMRFCPAGIVSREQMAAFLWRAVR